MTFEAPPISIEMPADRLIFHAPTGSIIAQIGRRERRRRVFLRRENAAFYVEVTAPGPNAYVRDVAVSDHAPVLFLLTRDTTNPNEARLYRVMLDAVSDTIPIEVDTHALRQDRRFIVDLSSISPDARFLHLVTAATEPPSKKAESAVKHRITRLDLALLRYDDVAELRTPYG